MANKGRKGRAAGGESVEGFSVLRTDVAGIDVGSEEHWVCAPALTGVGREVAVFAATTPGVEQLAAWLKERGVTAVALESTGVYWIAPHEILERRGFDVLLVDTRDLARVPGRKKSDRRDCEWIQRLHSCGLLRGAFRPVEQVCVLRTLVRDKATLVAERGDWVRRMQKSLDQMNVRIHRAVADLDGATGMAILRAIVAGERDPRQLATLRDPRCRKSEAEIADQLSGHWREDHLFSLKQAVKMYDAITETIQAYEREILRQLEDMARADRRNDQAPPPINPQKAKGIKYRGEDPLRHALYRMSGVDVTAIDAIGVETVSVVLSEYGPDLSQFPTEKQFVSHVGLAPHKPISGGKVVKNKKKPGSATARVGAALRMAALSLRHSQTALGGYYRQVARRAGADVAVFATARKLAQYIYRLLRWGQPYVDEGAATYERRYQLARVKRLSATAKDLGYTLVSVEA
ncbi:MAG TPA: IS110 family transposase [Dehalococcoidia bacterium]|nr:IS110 family transposase [Dehalococcoidia bacterium]